TAAVPGDACAVRSPHRAPPPRDSHLRVMRIRGRRHRCAPMPGVRIRAAGAVIPLGGMATLLRGYVLIRARSAELPFADSGNHATRKERMPRDTQAAALCERTAGGYIPSSLWDEDRNPPMPRPWTRRQLERFPELSRFAPDDAFAQRCCRPLRAGWWNAALLNATVVFLWSIVWGVVCFLWLASSGSPRLPAPSPVGAILASLLWIAGLVVAVWF